MIEITHILWKDRKIGVALWKLRNGENQIKITVKNKYGQELYPDILTVDKIRSKKNKQKFGWSLDSN